jgi:alginate O-acetyltransferase complex protein AlgI
MLFNSFEFAVFLPLVFIAYWFVVNKSLNLQNLLILVSSYLFYGWWDWRFLLLLLASTLIDYTFGILLHNRQTKRKLVLWLSIFNNLAVLGFFKYFNFFADSFAKLFGALGFTLHPYMLQIALPVGISFYTFHGMSYVFDIYRGIIKPERDFVKYSCFVSFFPLLVAGPIERATHLLPQFSVKKEFSYALAADGLRQALWGLFKKMVIADNCAPLVNLVFDDYHNMSGASLLVGTIFFSFQIYCDFSGYSDMALGVAKLFGFTLIRNFAFPYFSRDIAEFWRRWHISLSSWFRDYVYIPLGGSKGGTLGKIRNTFIIFVLSGFWHGANWTFLVWGALNAIYFLPLLMLKRNRLNMEIVAYHSKLPNVKEFMQMSITFLLTSLAWVFFRAENIGQALEILKAIASPSLLSVPAVISTKLILFIAVLIIVEWIQRKKQHALEFTTTAPPQPIRWLIYITLTVLIIAAGAAQQTFIYFQF